jgi:hypothetical protein
VHSCGLAATCLGRNPMVQCSAPSGMGLDPHIRIRIARSLVNNLLMVVAFHFISLRALQGTSSFHARRLGYECHIKQEQKMFKGPPGGGGVQAQQGGVQTVNREQRTIYYCTTLERGTPCCCCFSAETNSLVLWV